MTFSASTRSEYSRQCEIALTSSSAMAGRPGNESECQSARMSEIKNGRLGLYGTEHSKCNHMMTLGLKEL